MNFGMSIVSNGMDIDEDVYIIYDVKVRGSGVIIYEKYYTDDECTCYFINELEPIRVISPKGTSSDREDSMLAEHRWY